MKPFHWRVWVVGYLLWLIAFTVVEGTGRQACAMPMQKWIDSAANSQERYVRGVFRDRAYDCLQLTRGYSYSVAGLFTLGLIAPLTGVWISRRQRFAGIRTAALVFGAVFVVSLAVTLGTMVAVRWAYDHLG